MEDSVRLLSLHRFRRCAAIQRCTMYEIPGLSLLVRFGRFFVLV